MSGIPLTFSPLDLQLMAVGYSKARRRAPLVLGHPANNLPEFGDVESLFVNGDALYAETSPSPGLVGMVRMGAYKNVSASFIAPDSIGNHTPGAYYLRHIGFLGAHPPAVKGMTPPDFAEHDGYISFSEGCEIPPNSSVHVPGLADGYQFAEPRMQVFNLASDFQRACPQMDFIEAVRRAEFSMQHQS